MLDLASLEASSISELVINTTQQQQYSKGPNKDNQNRDNRSSYRKNNKDSGQNRKYENHRREKKQDTVRKYSKDRSSTDDNQTRGRTRERQGSKVVSKGYTVDTEAHQEKVKEEEKIETEPK